MTKQIEAMRKLGWSDEEIKKVLEDDKRIDKGEKLFELSPELEAGAKKARQADRKPTERKPREKKIDEDKEKILSALQNAVAPLVPTDLTVANSEREFSFTYHNKKFKVVLSCPRS